MNRPKPYHRPDLAGRLVSATRAVVETDGPQAVTVARVAHACEVSVAAPYRHFGGKDALLDAVAEQGFDELRAMLTCIAARRESTLDLLVEIGVAYVDFALSHRHLFRLMFDEARDRGGATRRPVVVDALRGAGRRDVSALAVRSTWALAHGFAVLGTGGVLADVSARDGRRRSLDRVRHDLRAVVGGLVPRTA